MDTPTCPYVCKHEETQIRKRTQSNGVLVCVRQCLRCGSNRGAVPKKDVALDMIRDWDEELCKYWDERRAFWYKNQSETKKRQWWEFYHEYMKSDEWKRKRLEVLKRCDWICQGCGKKEAVHVHHLTYERLGHEMLFDLVGVCLSCHELIHGRELEVRG